MTLPTVGEILRTEREKQGMTVKDVEKGTSIRALYIQAIEDGKYDVLPGEVYLKGFIRNYATFLGLSPQEMLALYRESQESQAPQPPPVPPGPVKTETRREPSRNGGSISRWVIALVVVAVIAGAAWAAMNYLYSPTPPPAPAKPPQTQVHPTPAPAPAPQTAPAPAPAARSITITAKYTAACWTQVIADGREIYEGIPKAGDNHTWNANQTMTVRLGNAAGVDITYNGQPQGKLGGEGEVIAKTFSVNTTTGTQR